MNIDIDITAGVANTITAIATLVAGIAAVIAARIAVRTLKASQRDSHERTRPMIGVDLKPAPRATTYFVVRNYGPSPAYNVTVTVDPPFEEMDGDWRTLGRYIDMRYSQPIPTLMGGSELSNLFESQSLGDQPQIGANRITATVTYDDEPTPRKSPTYTNKYVLDPAVFALETKVSSSRDPDRSLATLAKTSEEILRVLRKR